MAETIRSRPVEYYNPRPPILGTCFFLGVVFGFCLYLFRAQDPVTVPPIPAMEPAITIPPAPASELERRRLDAPDIAEVGPAPAVETNRNPRFEDLEIGSPAVILNTEGGLTGRNAKPLSRRRVPAAPGLKSYPGAANPPPLPDLMP